MKIWTALTLVSCWVQVAAAQFPELYESPLARRSSRKKILSFAMKPIVAPQMKS